MEDLLEKNHVICRTYDSVGTRERLMPLVYDFCRRKYESAEDIEKRCQEFLDEHFDDMQMILQNEFLEIATNSKYTNIKIDIGKLGIYKSKYWAFQKEWRYIMSFIPLNFKGGPEGISQSINLTAQKLLLGMNI